MQNKGRHKACSASYLEKFPFHFYMTVLRSYRIEAEISPQGAPSSRPRFNFCLAGPDFSSSSAIIPSRGEEEVRVVFYVSVGEVEKKEGGLERWNAFAGRGGVYDCVIK